MSDQQYIFTTFFIKDNLGIKVDRLKDWMKRGYIVPSIETAGGIGTKNFFNRNDLYLIILFEYLTSKKGFSRSDAAERIKSIRNLLKIANEDHRIKKTKLNTPGIEEIVEKWKDLSKIDFLIFYWIEDRIKKSMTVNTPPAVDAIILQNESVDDHRELNWDYFLKSDDVLTVNFRNIRKRVDAVIG